MFLVSASVRCLAIQDESYELVIDPPTVPHEAIVSNAALTLVLV
jgi:hypothetical protein